MHNMKTGRTNLAIYSYSADTGRGNRDSILIRAMRSISASDKPRPRGGAARSIAYSPSKELRNGRVSSVYVNIQLVRFIYG
jgi:hypothetical protein